jgi:Carboxypeptidase regulatory-like domain
MTSKMFLHDPESSACSLRSGDYGTGMTTQLPRMGSILLAFGFMAASAFAQNCSIQGAVKGMDGKPLPGATVKVERTDGNARAVNLKSDAKGNYVANGLPVGTFKVAAYDKMHGKEIGGITTKSGSAVTVDLNLSTKSNNKLEKHYVWQKSEAGNEIGGRWVEDSKSTAAPANSKPNAQQTRPSQSYGGMGH